MDPNEVRLLKSRLENIEQCYRTSEEAQRDIKKILNYIGELETKLKVHDDAETWQQTIERGRQEWKGPKCSRCGRGPGWYEGWCGDCVGEHDL